MVLVCGFTATPREKLPAGMVATTVLVCPLITDTVGRDPEPLITATLLLPWMPA